MVGLPNLKGRQDVSHERAIEYFVLPIGIIGELPIKIENVECLWSNAKGRHAVDDLITNSMRRRG